MINKLISLLHSKLVAIWARNRSPYGPEIGHHMGLKLAAFWAKNRPPNLVKIRPKLTFQKLFQLAQDLKQMLYCNLDKVWNKKYFMEYLIKLGVTSSTSSLHPCLPWHPGWESLIHGLGRILPVDSIFPCDVINGQLIRDL